MEPIWRAADAADWPVKSAAARTYTASASSAHNHRSSVRHHWTSSSRPDPRRRGSSLRLGARTCSCGAAPWCGRPPRAGTARGCLRTATVTHGWRRPPRVRRRRARGGVRRGRCCSVGARVRVARRCHRGRGLGPSRTPQFGSRHDDRRLWGGEAPPWPEPYDRRRASYCSRQQATGYARNGASRTVGGGSSCVVTDVVCGRVLVRPFRDASISTGGA